MTPNHKESSVISGSSESQPPAGKKGKGSKPSKEDEEMKRYMEELKRKEEELQAKVEEQMREERDKQKKE
jgi:hypothetical protein